MSSKRIYIFISRYYKLVFVDRDYRRSTIARVAKINKKLRVDNASGILRFLPPPSLPLPPVWFYAFTILREYFVTFNWLTYFKNDVS